VKWLQSHSDQLDWILQWLKAWPKPPTNNKGDMKLEKDRGDGIILYQEKWDCYVQTSKYAAYGLSNAAKQIVIEQIKNGKLSDADYKDVVYDSDETYGKRTFEKDEKVDCLDTDLNWLNAQIIETNAHYNAVRVKYDGWSDKWNEWLPVSSPRLAKSGVMTQYNPPKKKKGT